LKIWAKKISLWHLETRPRVTGKLRFKNRDEEKQLFRFVINEYIEGKMKSLGAQLRGKRFIAWVMLSSR
jgi:hypothetical protein